MFHSHEILKRGRKFGIIWLAATAPDRLNKSDVSSVDVAKSSADIVDILTLDPSSMVEKLNIHCPLYLLSQLIFGLVEVNKRKSDMLLDDVKTLTRIMGSCHQKSPLPIDLQEPLRRFEVTFDEPSFENAPIEFGSFSVTDESSDFTPNEHSLVSSPHSSVEWQISPGLPDNLRSLVIEAIDKEDDFVSRLNFYEDIAIQEVDDHAEESISIDIFSTTPDIDVPEKPFLCMSPVPSRSETAERSFMATFDEPNFENAPIDFGSFSRNDETSGFIPSYDYLIFSIPRNSKELQIVPEFSIELQSPSSDVPDVPKQAGQRRGLRRRKDETSSSLPNKPVKKLRKSTPHAAQPKVRLTVEPVPARAGRHRRRRHQFKDAVTFIPFDALRNNIETANQVLVRPFDMCALAENVQSMFSRFGLREAAHGNRRFWRNLRTLPELNDLSRFGHFLDEPYETVPGNRRFWRNLRTLSQPNDPTTNGHMLDVQPENVPDVLLPDVPEQSEKRKGLRSRNDKTFLSLSSPKPVKKIRKVNKI